MALENSSTSTHQQYITATIHVSSQHGTVPVSKISEKSIQAPHGRSHRDFSRTCKCQYTPAIQHGNNPCQFAAWYSAGFENQCRISTGSEWLSAQRLFTHLLSQFLGQYTLLFELCLHSIHTWLELWPKVAFRHLSHDLVHVRLHFVA